MIEIGMLLSSGYPATIWFVPLIVLALLATASFADARTGRVPDALIGVGVLGTLGGLAWGAGWLVAGERALYVIAAVAALRLVNHLYYRLFSHDAFGFGDAKWTGLAVAGFGLVPVCWAWAIGAWLALIWMGLRCVWRKVSTSYCGHAYVHFAPFLFLGLMAALLKAPILRLIGQGI